MHGEACVVVNGMSLTGGEVRPNNCTGEAYRLVVNTPSSAKPGVCHHFRECGINSLVARMPRARARSKKQQQKKQ